MRFTPIKNSLFEKEETGDFSRSEINVIIGAIYCLKIPLNPPLKRGI
jgi:hypothetical protein